MSSARSVAFPPKALFADTTLPELNTPFSLKSSATIFPQESTPSETCPLPSMYFTASNSPFVSVPVLSVKRIFTPPDASMPTGFLTMTLSFNILSIFEERTTAIIIGSPSGTATTTMAIASVRACMSRGTQTFQFRISAKASEKFIPLSMKKLLKRSATAMRTAAIYPRRLSVLASPASLTRSGLSGGSSCISRASPP